MFGNDSRRFLLVSSLSLQDMKGLRERIHSIGSPGVLMADRDRSHFYVCASGPELIGVAIWQHVSCQPTCQKSKSVVIIGASEPLAVCVGGLRPNCYLGLRGSMVIFLPTLIIGLLFETAW